MIKIYVYDTTNPLLQQCTMATTISWPLYRITCKPALASGTHSYKLDDFAAAKITANMPLLTANSAFRLCRERTLEFSSTAHMLTATSAFRLGKQRTPEFSSTVLPAPSLYHHCSNIHITHRSTDIYLMKLTNRTESRDLLK